MKTILDVMFGGTLPGIQKTMDLTWKRNEAISSNIANTETPGYRAVDVNFAGELEAAFQNSPSPMLKTNAKHLDVSTSSSAHLTPDLSGVTKPDGNNVDIDVQMGRLAYNRGKYSIAAQILRKKLSMMALAIRQAGG